MQLTKWWHRAFLERRPSVSLGVFRLAVAWTVGAHVIPSFLQMPDNYLSTAFKIKNFSFFPVTILRLVERSPDGVVWGWVGAFALSLGAFTLGLWSQASGVILTLSCYYFYALNSLHIGTLSFDILLVTLFLMCVTGYHGDALSLDSVLRGKDRPYARLRPIFLQRLLQLQLAWTFWYTALSKITARGNWLTGNPYLALMHDPPMSVVRDFPGRAWLGHHPSLCYGLGLGLLMFELTLPCLWFIPRTRAVGITLGIAFQLMLWGTLHVPTIFLFLFPAMMLLFVQPETIVRWIERRRECYAKQGRGLLLYDGRCGFCLASVKRLRVLDVFGWVDPLDFHAPRDLTALHPSLTPDRLLSEMVLVEPSGLVSGGFDAFARLTLRLPCLWALAPAAHLPGAGWIGRRVYRWVATHRSLLHRNPVCETNQCAWAPSQRGQAHDHSENA